MAAMQPAGRATAAAAASRCCCPPEEARPSPGKPRSALSAGRTARTGVGRRSLDGGARLECAWIEPVEEIERRRAELDAQRRGELRRVALAGALRPNHLERGPARFEDGGDLVAPERRMLGGGPLPPAASVVCDREIAEQGRGKEAVEE